MTTEQEKAANDSGQSKNIREREALSNAYAALLGQQTTQAWTAFTFEEAVDAQVESIEGPSTDKRPNLLERVDKIEQECLAAIKTLRVTPPEQFREPDPDQDVNTEREADD
jgi:hypothetical protein